MAFGRPHRARAPALAVAMLCAIAAGDLTAAAQTRSPSEPPDAVRRKLETEKRLLEEARKRRQGIEQEVKEIDRQRAEITARLIDAADQVQKSEARLTEIEDRLKGLEKEQAPLRDSLRTRHRTISRLLSAMQRMGRNPPPVLITQRQDALQMVRSAMLLARAFPKLGEEAREIAGKLQALVSVMDRIRGERERLLGETKRITEQRTKLSSLLVEKQRTLADRRQQLEAVRKASEEHASSVTGLSELIAKMDQVLRDKGDLGAYERELAARPKATPPATAAAPSQVPAKTAGRDGGKPVEVSPRQQVALFSPGRLKPAIPFEEAKGKLRLPVQGRRLLSYGDKTQYGGTSKGLVVETRPGAYVIAPCDGWIVHASRFRNYGQLLIINGGGGYHVLLAGMSQINVEMGRFVLAGEPVGTMAAPSATPQVQEQAPVLYIEFRNKTRPIDPEPWWAVASKKVQG
ncbi:MAG: murein hydrolase activator EnvC [Hyphomicrobiaceae bacterium]